MTVADQEQLAVLKQGVDVWNKWREDNPKEHIELSGTDLPHLILHGANLRGANLRRTDLTETDFCRANLSRANLSRANLMGANLIKANFIKAYLKGADFSGADLSGAYLRDADLSGANLREADLTKANLSNAVLSHADLTEADLRDVDLMYADLSGADLSGANLCAASLVGTNLTKSVLTDCKIFGISAWNLKLEGAEQSNLVITHNYEPTVTVDDLEVAQFIYLLLNNKKIRGVLDTIGKKGVLILGRFTPERKQVLDALRDKLRKLNFVPMMFDFEGAESKDFTETVMILAGMSRFIIADITDPKCSPLELQATVPDYKVPFVPIIQEGEQPFAMLADLQDYPWMFDLLVYRDSDQLIGDIEEAIIQPALIKAAELNAIKAEGVRKRYCKDR